MYRCMYIWLFSRSDGAGSATRRNTRGLTRSVMALMVPPFPAASRPSKTMMTFAPFALTHSCSTQSSACSLSSSFAYALPESFSLPSFFSLPLSFDMALVLVLVSGLRLPAAAEGPVKLGTRAELLAARLRKPQLLLEEILIGGQNLDVTG